jgi:hypothetical protein
MFVAESASGYFYLSGRLKRANEQPRPFAAQLVCLFLEFSRNDKAADQRQNDKVQRHRFPPEPQRRHKRSHLDPEASLAITKNVGPMVLRRLDARRQHAHVPVAR